MNPRLALNGWTRWLLLTCAALAGCVEQVVQDPGHAVAEHRENLESAVVCGRQFEPLAPSIKEGRTSVPGRVLAGFLTSYQPGRQPVPCNRLTRVSAQGQLEFAGSIDPALRGNIATAFLEVVSFEPVFPVSVTEARPWGSAVSGGWSGEMRNRCRFVVRSFTDRTWRPAEPEADVAWQASRDLTIAGNSSQFWAPLSRPALINITSELLGSITGDAFRLHLTIEPDDLGQRAQANNTCAGLFEVRLKLLGAS